MNRHHIEISIARQELRLKNADGNTILAASVSTAANGPGEEQDSECTPRGSHYICAKIGAGAPVNAVFVGRRLTGERYSNGFANLHPERDWILTRILWLKGNETGRNRGGKVDTQRRYIYIHGAPDNVQMGVPGSRGCVRMRNDDLIRLFDLVEIGTPVQINED